ncbi:MAG: T3SS effector HopA1 family protein [Brasilonema sp.]
MMQLLDSHPKQLLNPLSNELLVALEDIVDQIQIESNFCIRHPDYKAWELPTEAVERFGQLPASLQHKYLSLQLQHFLYGIYYNGSLKTALAPNADSDEQALHQKLENNTVLGVDLAFYERLHISNSGKGYFDPGWQVLRQESDGSLAVTKGGLTLHIKRETHLPSNNQSATVGEEVAIRLPRNLVQNGFYMAVGNAGSSSHNNHRDSEPQIVRIYFNLSPEGSVAVMDSLTRQLNAISLSFSFKVLYNPSDYGRYDSGVLYFDKSDYGVIQPVVEAVYTETRSHFKAEIPLFTKFLAA